MFTRLKRGRIGIPVVHNTVTIRIMYIFVQCLRVVLVLINLLNSRANYLFRSRGMRSRNFVSEHSLLPRRLPRKTLARTRTPPPSSSLSFIVHAKLNVSQMKFICARIHKQNAPPPVATNVSRDKPEQRDEGGGQASANTSGPRKFQKFKLNYKAYLR